MPARFVASKRRIKVTTMTEVIDVRAAVLAVVGKPLEIRDVADPDVGDGEVVVEVLATCVLPCTQEVFSGARNYPLEPPVVPGLGGSAG
jgi:alcohol dehydrogenase